MQIVPIVMEELYSYQVPSDFDPHVYEQVNVTF
jgi:hypothetical protein